MDKITVFPSHITLEIELAILGRIRTVEKQVNSGGTFTIKRRWN